MNTFQKTVTTFLIAAICAPLAFAQGGDADRRPNRGNPAQRFARIDTDGNGEISQAEAEAIRPGMWARLSRADTDGSGGVSMAEMRAFRRAHGRNGEGRGRGRNGTGERGEARRKGPGKRGEGRGRGPGEGEGRREPKSGADGSSAK